MAAIDPDASPEYEDDADSSKPPRATLKIIRVPEGMDEEEDSDDEDYEDDDEMDSEEDSDDEEVNGGPSDKEKAKKQREAAALKDLADAMDEDDSGEDGEVDIASVISKLIKGKGRAADDEDDEDDEEEGLELEEVVVCTLDTQKVSHIPTGKKKENRSSNIGLQQYQQPLDITVSEHERIFFKVTGTHTVYLTGNYVMPTDEGRQFLGDEDDEDDDEYDLSPDEDEDLEDFDINALLGGDDSDDDLDDLEDPRVTEVDSEEEVPKLVSTKGKNKRAAEEDTPKAQPATNGDAALSKKQQKKLKKNNGEAAAVEAKKDTKETASAKTDKKVQFAKNLEQGPTGSTPVEKTTGTLGVKEVQGVKIDDKKLGKGPAAKSGNTVAMRYIGKFEDGKVFDCKS